MSENEEKSLDPLLALSPCPFCGGRPELHSFPDSEDSIHCWVKCQTCGALSGESLAESTPDQEFAITAWNTRTANARGDGVSIADDTVEAYCAAVEAHLESLTPKDWEIERFDPKASVRRVARIGLEAARINEVNAVLYRVQEYMHTHHDFLVSIDEYMEGSKQPTTDEICQGEADLTSTPGSEVRS